jgi:hypothetical protein
MSTHSCAVVRMESEQNSSTLRHYLNLYGSLAGRQPFPDHEVYVRGKLENDPQRYAHYLYPQRLDEILDLEILRMSLG